MKIYFYINELGGGGAERVIANLASEFAAHGYETGIVTSYPINNEYTVSFDVKRFNLEEKRITSEDPIKRNVRRIRLLRDILKAEKPEILITFMAEPNYRGILASVGLKTKTIISVRNDPEKEYNSKLDKILARVLLPHASGCVFQTNNAKKWFSKRLQNKSRIIFNAVRDEFFSAKWNPKDNVIVACGRLEPQKNYPMLIRSMQEVIKTCPNAVLEIYGKGKDENALKELVTSLGLSSSVFFMGQTNNVVEVLERASVFTLSSDFEGMPNALMEALAVGVPCVSTDCPCGGPQAIITNRKNGILVEVGDYHNFAKAIIELLQKRDFAISIGREARIEAKKFESKIVFGEWENLVVKVLSIN